MTEPAGDPGVLIGRGRAADVYALDDRRVLRRYRTSYSCTAEADLMRYLRQAGFPVPAVFDADGTDLVMERLDGRDMLADLASRPWQTARHARVLARLHDRLHQIAAPEGLRQPFGSGDRVVHLDLHPRNVMLTPGGPVVIDWTNAAAGPAGADVAMADLIMASSDVDDLPAGSGRPRGGCAGYSCGGSWRPFGMIPGRTWPRWPGTGSGIPTCVQLRPNGCGGSPA